MGKKIYPNDPCPCGSGKKYKNCCGRPFNLSDFTRSDLQMEDFVQEKLAEDLFFLNEALQSVFGPSGYQYCSNHNAELEQAYEKDQLRSLVKGDVLEVFKRTSGDEAVSRIKKETPYGGGKPKKEYDIFSLDAEGFICRKGRQVELFHAYLMYNLDKRFDKYFYLPEEQWVGFPYYYGLTAHRGYDFLFAMTIYLEMQLGVPVYMDSLDFNEGESCVKDSQEYFGFQISDDSDPVIPNGVWIFLNDYRELLVKLDKRYKPLREFQLYNEIGVYKDTPGLYENLQGKINRKNLTPGFDCDYLKYLRYLVPAICFQELGFLRIAQRTFPQCDLLKYLRGLDVIHELFEENFESRRIDLDELDADSKKQLEDQGRSAKSFDYSWENLYHAAVFYMADELNGVDNSVPTYQWTYEDFADITEDEFYVREGEDYATVNPARKSTRPDNSGKQRKLRLEIYQMLNGRMFNLFEGEKPGEKIKSYDHTAARYPVLPWLSSGKEDTFHAELFDETRTWEDLFSRDVNLRQQFLQLEMRLTEIPANCIEEYLNPDIFYTWHEKQESLKELEKKNVELQKTNDKLDHQIKLNNELVRNLSHSSVNYLNPAKLAETGVELQNADGETPGVDELHQDGHSLVLQSEQETYMSRQLNSLVWRCAGDPNYLFEQICSGLTKNGGVDVTDPIGFALKSLLARILYREQDLRSSHIREKLQKTEEEWGTAKSSFLQDVLATKSVKGESVIDWWNRYISDLVINVSDFWKEICIVPGKAFYDLIAEITTEQILNALSHGDLSQPIRIEFGEEKGKRDRIRWGYILCENTAGNAYPGGREVGSDLLNDMLLMLNEDSVKTESPRGLERKETDGVFYSKAWLKAKYLQPLD